jgi:hypothetical protein
LLVGVAALISSLVSAGALWVSVRRGSDRENRRAAQAIAEQVIHNAVDPGGDVTGQGGGGGEGH